MFSLIVTFKVKPGKSSEFLAAISKVISSTRREAGNVLYQLSADESDETRYFLYEIYTDRQAYESHTREPYLSEFREEIKDLLASAPDVIRGPVIQ